MYIVNLEIGKIPPSYKRITIRLPEGMIAQLKEIARRLDVPYQSLIKQILYLTLNKKNASDILDL